MITTMNYTPMNCNNFLAKIENIEPYCISSIMFLGKNQPYSGGISGGVVRVELFSAQEFDIEKAIVSLCKKKTISDVEITLTDNSSIPIRSYVLNQATIKNIFPPSFSYNDLNSVRWSIDIGYKKLIIK